MASSPIAVAVIFTLILNHTPLFAGDTHTDSATVAYARLVGQIKSLKPDWNKTATIHNITFRRDRGTFVLKEGVAAQCVNIAGGRHALAFHGNGLFTMSFPDDIERQQYRRFMERDSAAITFTDLFLFFADSTLRELSRACSFQPGKEEGALESVTDRPLQYLLERDDFMFTLLQRDENGLFFAFIETPDSGNYYFMADPLEREEIIFGRENTTLLHRSLESINRFYAVASPKVERDMLLLSSYVIDATIKSNLDFNADVRLTFQVTVPGIRWASMYLYSQLVVDSVVWMNGERAGFVRPKDDPTLWIMRQKPFVPGDTNTVRIFYHGDLLAKNELEWISIKSPDGWFPRYGYISHATFDITYHFPAKYRLASVGRKLSSRDDVDVTTSRWVTSSPIHNASFNIGLFQEYKINEQGIPPVTVYMSDVGHRKALNMDENVGADVANSMTFFTKLFGRTDIGEFYATEIPYGHGEAFPGLIHLSWATFSYNDHRGVHESFRAHEVAHQWWGIGVGFDTYHDQWLSEAFAEYSGLWYLQAMMKGNEEFFDILDLYREQILSNRTYLFGKGQEAGPISLGWRTSSLNTAGDYGLIIYEKGAWVLHMLRGMLLNLNSMNEDKFHALMRDFYTKFRGKRPSTHDFAALVSDHFGRDMQWFFREWVDDTRIPNYKFAYKVSETGDGHYKVSCRVQQDGVAPDFTMPIPLLIKFSENRLARTRIVVKGPITEVDLSVLPLKPEEIMFNDLHSVLCTWEEADWE